MKNPVDRRRFLKGLGTVIALPYMESLWSAKAMAADQGKKLVVVYFPNGMIMNQFLPPRQGILPAVLPPTLQALNPFRDELLVISGLTHTAAQSASSGAHARAAGSFLSNTRIAEIGPIRSAKSMDQKIADYINDSNSLHLGVENYACDLACAYSRGLSWRSETQMKPREISPASLFNQMFADANSSDANVEATELKKRQRKSILDFVKNDADALNKKLGGSDQKKLDQWLTSIRETEQRIDRLERVSCELGVRTPVDGTGAERMKEMFNLINLAFQCNLSRVAVFMMGDEGSNINFDFLPGVNEQHHQLSHHGDDPNKIDQLAKINRWETEQFAAFLSQMKADETVWNDTIVMYSCGISDGNAHSHTNIPMILTGGGLNATKSRHINLAGIPLANLNLTLMQQMGLPDRAHGDSTGSVSL